MRSVATLGRFGIFTWDSMRWLLRRPFRLHLLIDDLEFIGNESLFIIVLTGFFTGAVLAFQSWLAFTMVGTESLVSVSVSLSLVRELGPVMTGLVVAGRAGAAIAAQLGNMRVSEQIDAMEVMAVSPLQYLVAPKVVAGTIAIPLLAGLFSLIGNLGGWIVSVYVCNVDPGIYVDKLRFYLDPWDFYHGIIKAAAFGFLLTAIACYTGFRARGGAAGVGRATNSAVVLSFVMILILDYFLSVLVPTGIRTQG
jgi:phospholipid/cholesterol/gamma-HCH transport system permease protein